MFWIFLELYIFEWYSDPSIRHALQTNKRNFRLAVFCWGQTIKYAFGLWGITAQICFWDNKVYNVQASQTDMVCFASLLLFLSFTFWMFNYIIVLYNLINSNYYKWKYVCPSVERLIINYLKKPCNILGLIKVVIDDWSYRAKLKNQLIKA